MGKNDYGASHWGSDKVWERRKKSHFNDFVRLQLSRTESTGLEWILLNLPWQGKGYDKEMNSILQKLKDLNSADLR